MTDKSYELKQIQAQLQAIEELLQARDQQANVQKGAFDALYKEMEQYKSDFIFQSEKPLLLDLLLFFDSMNWFKQSLLKQENDQNVLADSFQYLLDEFMEVLYRRDVVPQESQEVFNPRTQRAIQVLPTPRKDKDQHVEKILKRGFVRAGRTLRPEEVVVHRFQRPDDADDCQDDSTESSW
jgi:molecular chaperone GrpE (heat shock protein)